MRKNENGFSLIEIMVVVMILTILAGIAIAVFSTTKARASEKVCQTSRYHISRTFHQLLSIDSELTMQEVLDNANHEYFKNEATCPDGGIYSIIDNVITCSIHGSSFIDVSTSATYHYDFSNMSEEDIEALLNLVITQSNDEWEVVNENGRIALTNLTTGENRIFFPVELDTYTIKSTIQLDGRNGYGIMVESVTEDNAKDTGYIFQFDPGYNRRNGGTFVFRERSNGGEYSPFETINPADVIPDFDKDTFWNEEHDVVVDIVDYSSTQKQMKVYIDGIEITVNDTILIDSSDEDTQTYVGFRSWGSSHVNISDLEVTGND